MNSLHQFMTRAGGIVLALVWITWQTNAATTPAATGAQTNLPPAPPPIPKSVFVDDPQTSRDPFYPNSTRRAVRAAEDRNQKAAARSNPADELMLKGFLGSVSKPLALINGQTFAVGDEAVMKVAGGQLKVRCVEINVREKYVAVVVDGGSAQKRLPLRSE